MDSGIDFAKVPHYSTVQTPDSPYFPIGILDTPEGRFGVLRIALFSQFEFPEMCEEQVAAMKLSPTAPCEGGCAGPLERETANRVTAAFERQLRQLESKRIAALMVDITGNGGGDNWVEVAMRPLTAHALKEPRSGYIRHEHWVTQLSDKLDVVEADARRARGDYQKQPVDAAKTLRSALDEARKPCVRDDMWNDQLPGCSLVVSEPPLYSSGLLAYARPGSRPPDNLSCCPLFYPVRFTYEEGTYSGPLFILVDRETASAAEEFAAVLADNQAAVVVGEPTYGAGCGYTNGGILTALPHSGAVVRMPDCVRFRADGSNEVAGITPDVLLPWRSNDGPLQRAKRVWDGIPQMLRQANARIR